MSAGIEAILIEKNEDKSIGDNVISTFIVMANY